MASWSLHPCACDIDRVVLAGIVTTITLPELKRRIRERKVREKAREKRNEKRRKK